MAEELNLHLLEFTGAEGEVPRRAFVAKAFPHLCNSKRHTHAAAVEYVLEVDEDALGGIRTQKRVVLFRAEGTNDGLEHQVEVPRRGERPQRIRIGLAGLHIFRWVDFGEGDNSSLPD